MSKYFFMSEITWSRLPGDTSPYTVLTIGDTKYSNNQRVAIEKPIRHDVSPEGNKQSEPRI